MAISLLRGSVYGKVRSSQSKPEVMDSRSRRRIFIRSCVRSSGYSGKKSSTGSSRLLIAPSYRAQPNSRPTTLLVTERTS